MSSIKKTQHARIVQFNGTTDFCSINSLLMLNCCDKLYKNDELTLLRSGWGHTHVALHLHTSIACVDLCFNIWQHYFCHIQLVGGKQSAGKKKKDCLLIFFKSSSAHAILLGCCCHFRFFKFRNNRSAVSLILCWAVEILKSWLYWSDFQILGVYSSYHFNCSIQNKNDSIPERPNFKSFQNIEPKCENISYIFFLLCCVLCRHTHTTWARQYYI